jgi:hypothetical protein
MRKLFGGAVACAVAVTSSMVAFGAGPVRAQELPGLEHREATLSPAEAVAGDEITVTSVDACSVTTGVVTWALFEAGKFSWEGPVDEDAVSVLLGDADLAEDGSWQVVFEAPASPVEAEGKFSPADELVALAEEEPEEPAEPGLEVYGPLPLAVDEVAYEWFGFCIDLTEPAYLSADITSHDDHPVLGFPLVDQADQVTAGPIDPCPVTGAGDSVYWQLETWPLDEDDPYEQIDGGYLEPDGEGGWGLSFPAPDDGDDVKVTFYALWVDCENDATVTGFYDLLLFAVGEEPLPSPPTEPPTRPEGPRPARPIVEAPDFTG